MAKKIEQTVELWNVLHEREIKSGRREPVTVTAKADNGSYFTVLPAAVAKALGLTFARSVKVTHADGRRARKRMVAGLRLRIPGVPDREITTDALVEPKRDTVLLGCEEMERMDLIADHRAGKLRPRPGTEKGITVVVD